MLAVIGLLLVVSTGLFARNDREHEWRYYQWEFKRKVTEKFGADKAKTVPAGLQQVWVPALGRADRCVTCHQATGWKGFETADEPFRTHPVEPLKNHPPRNSDARAATAARDGRWTWSPRTARGALGESRFWPARWRGLFRGRRQERAHADELQRLPSLRPADQGRGLHQPGQAARPAEGTGPAT